MRFQPWPGLDGTLRTHSLFWRRLTTRGIQDTFEDLHGSRPHNLKAIHRSAKILHLDADIAVRPTSILSLIIAGDRLYERLVRLVEYRGVYPNPEVSLAHTIFNRITDLFPLSLAIAGTCGRLRPPKDLRWPYHPRWPLPIPVQGDFCHSATCFISASCKCATGAAAGQYFHEVIPIARELDCGVVRRVVNNAAVVCRSMCRTMRFPVRRSSLYD